MRIISGKARGKRLATFEGNSIRPTPDRVREAIFSKLFSHYGSFDGLKVLDLFSGTGAMGLEALSRGVKRAILVDKGPQSIGLMQSNCKNCGFDTSAEILRSDVLSALPKLVAKGPFDLIFMDPPYAQGLVPQCLGEIDRLGLLAPGGMICAETGHSDPVPERLGRIERFDLRTYGTVTLHLFAMTEAETSEG